MIREAICADAEAIVEIQHQTWLTTYVSEQHGISAADVDDRFSNRRQRVSHIQKQFGDHTFKKWVAESDGKIVGYCGAERLPGMNHLGGFYILAKYQGSGLGRQLIQKALDWLDEDKPVKLTVAGFNQKAISFYEKYGFRMGARVSHEQTAFRSGADIPEYEMIRESK